MLRDRDWRPAAAYLYTLHLDRAALAWEYLRRNRDYQDDWQSQRHRMEPARRWGLRGLEDPELDARTAQPAWLVDPDSLVRLTADSDATTPAFSIWKLPGRKRALFDGRRLLLTSMVGHHQVRLALDDSVQEGVPVAYLLRSDDQAAAQWQAIQHQRRIIITARSASRRPLSRPGRSALLHMRCLQTLDGLLAGASQRTIAGMLFGPDWVSRHWDSDGELRNQIRYLTRSARNYLEGGYRKLLAPSNARAQGENAHPADSP